MYHRTATSFKIPQALQNMPEKESMKDTPITTDRLNSINSNFFDESPERSDHQMLANSGMSAELQARHGSLHGQYLNKYTKNDY